MTNYDASPMMADTPLSMEEVEALMMAEGRPVLKDGRKIMHMLRRMRITILSYRQQIRSLNNDIQLMRAQSEKAGAATTLHPRDAVRFLSPEQLAELVEGHLRDQLSVAERAMADARKARSNANADLAKVKFAIASLMEDPSIPADVRNRFEMAMRTMPQTQNAAPAAVSPAERPAQSAPQSAQAAGLEDLFS